ncbi:hypothetical protein [Pseudomonas sp. W4I3]|uniref:hypothetical protein n=1 Tax=Pseudomonas sp. W4I3 TaxID=3042294 RepID=UPI00277DE1DA|nr:hypothetical protein [Pseudomonas sp. W4I3]MDQ0739770.1 hypothetical protein [Pseudomonas sp. W4I3]
MSLAGVDDGRNGSGIVQKPSGRHAPTRKVVPSLRPALLTTAHAHVDLWIQAQVIALAYIRVIARIWPRTLSSSNTLISHIKLPRKKARTKYGQDRSFYQEPGVNRLSIEKQKTSQQFIFIPRVPTNGRSTSETKNLCKPDQLGRKIF